VKNPLGAPHSAVKHHGPDFQTARLPKLEQLEVALQLLLHIPDLLFRLHGVVDGIDWIERSAYGPLLRNFNGERKRRFDISWVGASVYTGFLP
jgi:hypothetical protein